nr:hypothetical protein [Nocardioides convexus]
MLGALTGLKPASHGRVIWQGHDLYQHYDQAPLPDRAGAAAGHPAPAGSRSSRACASPRRLRLPPDTTAQEWDARVNHVANRTGLVQRMDNRIGTQALRRPAQAGLHRHRVCSPRRRCSSSTSPPPASTRAWTWR